MTVRPPVPETLRDSLLAGLRRIVRLFWGADAEICDELISGRFFAPFLDLCTDISDLPAVTERLQLQIQTYADAAALCMDLDADYVRLFINSQSGIAAPLYESCYVEGTPRLMGPAAQRMKERLDTHNLSIGSHLQEPPDHIAVELEFLYFLLEKGFREHVPSLIEEGRRFCRETLCPWAALFHQQLAGHEPEGFYTDCSALLCAVLNWIGSRPEV